MAPAARRAETMLATDVAADGPQEPVPAELAARLHQLDRVIPEVVASADDHGDGDNGLLRQLRAERAALAAAATGNGQPFEAPARQELPPGTPRRPGAGYDEEEPWTTGYIRRQNERRSERAMRVEKLDARLAITAKRREDFLYLSGQRLAPETAEHLAQQLPRAAPRVHELYLASALYDLGASGWQPVVGLAQRHRLSKLYLGSNDIGTDGAVALAAALSGSPTLQVLELGENGIDDQGAQALAQLLKPGDSCCMSLVGLVLRGNVIGDAGAHQLCAAAHSLPSLQWFDLGSNPITDKRVWGLRGDMLER
jgi:hypothetical protein